jgi:hypothetical protein
VSVASAAVASLVGVADASPTLSDTAIANVINVTSADLPAPSTWTASVQTPNTATEITLAQQALHCISAKTGTISPDAFGTVGGKGGIVTADVESLIYSKKGTSTGLPEVSSDVDLLTTSSQASRDLTAFGKKVDLPCLTALIANVTAGVTGEKGPVASSFVSIPRHGTGNGGVGIRFAISGVGLSGPLIDDAYFYVEGRAEISLAFTNVSTPFSEAEANAVAARVMARAKAHI